MSRKISFLLEIIFNENCSSFAGTRTMQTLNIDKLRIISIATIERHLIASADGDEWVRVEEEEKKFIFAQFVKSHDDESRKGETGESNRHSFGNIQARGWRRKQFWCRKKHFFRSKEAFVKCGVSWTSLLMVSFLECSGCVIKE